MQLARGTFQITRGPGAPDPYLIEEIDNHSMAGAAAVDLLDEALPVHYDGWYNLQDAINPAICPGGKLCQDVASGLILLVSNTPPKPSQT